MTDTRMLRILIKKSGYKLCYIAECLGLTVQGLLNKINNKTEFKPSEIRALCELLKITEPEKREAIFFASDVD